MPKALNRLSSVGFARAGARQDGASGLVRVAGEVPLYDKPAERRTEHDRSAWAQRVDQSCDVVSPGVQIPQRGFAEIAMSMTPLVRDQNLRVLSRRPHEEPQP